MEAKKGAKVTVSKKSNLYGGNRRLIWILSIRSLLSVGVLGTLTQIIRKSVTYTFPEGFALFSCTSSSTVDASNLSTELEVCYFES